MNSDIKKWIPKDFEEFYKVLNTDQWNHMIYGEIIKVVNGIECVNMDENNIPDIHFNNNYSKKNSIKHKIVNV